MRPNFFENKEEEREYRIPEENDIKAGLPVAIEDCYEVWDSCMKKINAQYEKGPSMGGMGVKQPVITSFLYNGESCFKIEQTGEDKNNFKLVEKIKFSLEAVQQTETYSKDIPTLLESLKTMSERKYHIFTLQGRGKKNDKKRKGYFLGVFTIDWLECIYRNRVVLNKCSDDCYSIKCSK